MNLLSGPEFQVSKGEKTKSVVSSPYLTVPSFLSFDLSPFLRIFSYLETFFSYYYYYYYSQVKKKKHETYIRPVYLDANHICLSGHAEGLGGGKASDMSAVAALVTARFEMFANNGTLWTQEMMGGFW